MNTDELIEENRHLKDQLATLSKTHAKDMQRLSNMIDKRQEALRYISEIIEEKAENREDLELGSTAYKSVRRWASEFLHNDKILP
jgi:predicted DNA-binding protein